MKIYVVLYKNEPLYTTKYPMFIGVWLQNKFTEKGDRKYIKVRIFQDTGEEFRMPTEDSI